MIFSLIKDAISVIKDITTRHQALRELRKKGALEIEKAKQEVKIAKLHAIADKEKTIAKNTFDLDYLSMQQMEKSWKDEVLLFLIFLPSVLCFIPATQEMAKRGFEIIGTLPYWYQFILIGVIIVVFGLRGLTRSYLNKKPFFSPSNPSDSTDTKK